MKLTFLIIITALLLTPTITCAQTEDDIIFDNPVTSIGNDPSVSNIVGRAIKIALGIIGSIALILFIIAGFVWMTAQGNAEKIKKSQAIMLWAAIGLVVIFSSYILLTFVFNIIPK